MRRATTRSSGSDVADFINNEAAADEYTAACTIGPNFDARAVVLTIANNPALMQFAVGRLGAWRWTDEREYFSIPQSFRVGNVIGVRVRNANPGQIARVLATLGGDDDPDFQSGLPFTGTLSAAGTVSGSGAGMTLIQDIYVQSAPLNMLDFQAIPPDFRDLVIVCTLVATNGNDTLVGIRLNGDAGNNYYGTMNWTGGDGTAGFNQSDKTFAGSFIPLLLGAAGLSPAVTGEILIPNYLGVVQATKNFSAHGAGVYGGAAQMRNILASGQWAQVGAIDRVTLLCNLGSFDVGTRASLYGIT